MTDAPYHTSEYTRRSGTPRGHTANSSAEHSLGPIGPKGGFCASLGTVTRRRFRVNGGQCSKVEHTRSTF